ncbi:MAG: DUF3267 domain-containing protein [Lysinibacillus sp.]
MQPITLQFDINKLIRYNIIWTVLLTVILIPLNWLIQSQAFEWSFEAIINSFFLFSIYYCALIILHEACHLLGFIVFGRAPLKSISYGFKPKEGLAYATTTKRLSNRAMKAALLLPFWLTGVLPTVIGFYINSYTLILVGAFLMAGAVGDFIMYFALRKYPNHFLIQDDPEKPKLYVYEQ